jgi:hypothetical protein
MKPYIHNEYANLKLEEAEIMDKDTGSTNTKSVTGFNKFQKKLISIYNSRIVHVGYVILHVQPQEQLKFPGPQALAQMYRYVADSRDNAIKERLDIVDIQHGVWRCLRHVALYVQKE